MQTILSKLEKALVRGPVEVSRLLGVSYSNYAAMKAGSRPIPEYIRFHVETINMLSADKLLELLRKRLS